MQNYILHTGYNTKVYDNNGSISIVEANSTHPALIKCSVERVNESDNIPVEYNPLMKVFRIGYSGKNVHRDANITLPDTDNSTLYEIVYRKISSANSSYEFEFEYDIYMHHNSTDYTVARCGTRYVIDGEFEEECWSETYTLIRYNPAATTVNTVTSTITSTVMSTEPSTVTSTVMSTETSTVTSTVMSTVTSVSVHPTICTTTSAVCVIPTVSSSADRPTPLVATSRGLLEGISFGMVIVILIAAIELVVIAFLVRRVCTARTNDVTQPEIHANDGIYSEHNE